MDDLTLDDLEALTYQIKYLRKDISRLINAVEKLAEVVEDATFK